MHGFRRAPSQLCLQTFRELAKSACGALLAQYKHLKQEVVTLTSMAQDDCYYTMLFERLGLTNWGLQ